MTRAQIIKELDRIRAEVDKPDPDLRDVMDKLEAIERRLGSLESRPVVVEKYAPAPYYPYYRYDVPSLPPGVWCSTLTSQNTTPADPMPYTGWLDA